MERQIDLVVVGGCGHVGLPLAIAFANTGLSVAAFDINATVVDQVNGGHMPFLEPEGPEQLAKAIDAKNILATTDPTVINNAEYIVVVVGTPVDEHLNPDPMVVPNVIEDISSHMRPGQLLILRSTVYPGVTRLVENLMTRLETGVEVSFCPERIAEGTAFTELYSLPQIVSGRSEGSVDRASDLFKRLTQKIIVTTPEEAELAKLFTNTWRYIKFAAANQFYMMANDFGVDFARVRSAITTDYPRAADLPGAGFAAGPCLFKDTMQLASFHKNNFSLGHSAMMVNEGLPLYLVDKIEKSYDLSSLTVGILGMAFKANSDDIRSSLSYKLKRILAFKAKEVICTDPHVEVDPNLISIDDFLDKVDLVIVGVPHEAYREVNFKDVPVVDVWDFFEGGVLV